MIEDNIDVTSWQYLDDFEEDEDRKKSSNKGSSVPSKALVESVKSKRTQDSFAKKRKGMLLEFYQPLLNLSNQALRIQVLLVKSLISLDSKTENKRKIW